MTDQLFNSDSDDDIKCLLDDSDNTIFLTHFQATYVTESEKNQYFILSSVGNGELRLYKKSAQTLMGLYHRAHHMAKKLETLLGERKLPDKTYFEEIVDERADKKTGTLYRLNLTLNIYMGKVGLYLRSYYYIEEEERYQPTKRAIQFAIKDDDFNKFRQFVFGVSAPPSTPSYHDDASDKESHTTGQGTSEGSVHRLGSNTNKKRQLNLAASNDKVSAVANKNKKRRKDNFTSATSGTTKFGGSNH